MKQKKEIKTGEKNEKLVKKPHSQSGKNLSRPHLYMCNLTDVCAVMCKEFACEDLV